MLCYPRIASHIVREERSSMWPKWLRAALAGWVGFDSSRRQGLSVFWMGVVALLGPLLLPFYLVLRPLREGESRSCCLFWELLWQFEALVVSLLGFASLAVFAENFERSLSRDLAQEKRAEVLAGSLFSAFLIAVGFLFERLFVRLLRSHLEATREK